MAGSPTFIGAIIAVVGIAAAIGGTGWTAGEEHMRQMGRQPRYVGVAMA